MGGVGGAGFALPRDRGAALAVRVRLAWLAFLVRVSRLRAMPVGDRRSTGRRWWGGFRAAARGRSETGAPGAASLGRVSRLRAMPVGDRRSRRPCDSTRTSERVKNKWQRTSGSLPAISGESVKGGILPFHKTVMTNRNSPPRAEGAQGSFDCRREAPGGPRTGPQIQAELRPKAIPDHGPVRGPLDPDCRSETGAPWAALLGRVSRSRAMPVRDRRSRRRWWCGFRAHARCRSETGAPGGVGGAGFALPRDAGRRPALQAALVGRVSRCRAMPVGDRRSWGGVGGAGFALPRDAGRRPALLGRRRWGGFRAAARCRSETGAPGAASVGRVSRLRAMPVGDRRSRRPCDSTRTSERVKNKWQRTSGSLPAISGESVKGGILPFHKTVMTNRNSPPRAEGAQGSFDCRREAGRADPGRGPKSKQNYDRKLFRIMAPSGDRSTLIAGRRPALHGAASLGRVSRSRAMPVGDRRSTVPAIQRDGVLPSAQKTNGSEPLVRCRRFRGNV